MNKWRKNQKLLDEKLKIELTLLETKNFKELYEMAKTMPLPFIESIEKEISGTKFEAQLKKLLELKEKTK